MLLHRTFYAVRSGSACLVGGGVRTVGTLWTLADEREGCGFVGGSLVRTFWAELATATRGASRGCANCKGLRAVKVAAREALYRVGAQVACTVEVVPPACDDQILGALVCAALTRGKGLLKSPTVASRLVMGALSHES
jgi:hypothetical protein